MATTQTQDAGLVQRGMLLLGGMTALVVVVLLIVFRRPETPGPVEAERPGVIFPTVVPSAGFPATIDLPGLVQLSRQMPSAPGWEIRYNAALALARRGSLQTPWALLREILDEKQQRRNFRTVAKDGRTVDDPESAQRTVQNALAALGLWHEKQNRADFASIPQDLKLVYEQVDHLTQEGNAPVRVHADRVRKTFFR